jgi:hypothetical protein
LRSVSSAREGEREVDRRRSFPPVGRPGIGRIAGSCSLGLAPIASADSALAGELGTAAMAAVGDVVAGVRTSVRKTTRASAEMGLKVSLLVVAAAQIDRTAS